MQNCREELDTKGQTISKVNILEHFSGRPIIAITVCYTRSLNKFPDFFRMGTFIDSKHMKL